MSPSNEPAGQPGHTGGQVAPRPLAGRMGRRSQTYMGLGPPFTADTADTKYQIRSTVVLDMYRIIIPGKY